MDFDYTPGMSKDCGKPLCCRSDSGPAKDKDDAAGKWGDFLCDPPVRTIQTLLDYVNEDL
jgi:sphingomyelin phosphodiesterase